MVDFTVIPDTDVDPESPITTSLMFALRDNAVAVFDLLASETTLFTTGTGTWTAPDVPGSPVTQWRVVVSGVGGGGGGYSNTNGGGGGGAGGCMWKYEVDMDPGDEIDYTIGAGGTAANPGNDGGDTLITFFPGTTNEKEVKLTGGGGGTTGGINDVPDGGGVGGKAQVNIKESDGEAFQDNFVDQVGGPYYPGSDGGGGDSNDYGGYGADTLFGAGGKGGQDVPEIPATDGVGYGAGGGGSDDVDASVGGDGASGALQIRYYALAATLT